MKLKLLYTKSRIIISMTFPIRIKATVCRWFTLEGRDEVEEVRTKAAEVAGRRRTVSGKEGGAAEAAAAAAT